MRLPLPRRRAVLGALCAVGVPAALSGQSAQPAARRAFAPTDWYRVSVLSAPAVSPDGRRVAFTVQTMVERENRYHREVWVVPTAGGSPVRFTSPGTESSNPYFSPDGKYLFFTSSRPGGQGSSWALRMDEPGGEATQIGWAPPRAASWSRDGKLAVWADADSAGGPRGARPDSADPFARTPMARAPHGAITRPIDPRRFDGRHVVEFPYKANDRGYVPNRRDARRWTPSQLWALAAGDTVKKRITSTRYSHQGAALSPDGKWIAFVADSALRPDSVVEAERDSIARLRYDARRDEAERNTSDIYVIPATGGTPRRVATIAGAETGLSWSPDGKRIAFVWRPARTKSARLAAVDVATGEMKNLLGEWKYEPGDYEWLPNGDVMMNANVGGRGALFRVSPATGTITEVLGGRRRMSGFAYDAGKRVVAYVASSVTQPTELYVAGVDGKGERKLTAFNEKLTSEIAFSDAERFTYQSVGGLEVEGWLMKPYGYEPGKKYPLVLYIHGGPHSAYDEGWFDEFQNLAATGMWVLYTNPRGSSNYGAAFTYSTRGRWGAEDYEDLMKAVDIAAQRPDVDSTRMGVTGGSYGGFMTAWITTKTNRFKAAQTDRMISDWLSWYGSSDAQGLTEFEFYGKPWDNLALYDSISPIRHVHKVRTPTLIVQSEEDHRTPMANAELWFIALRKQGVPVEFVRYPRSTHELSRSGEPWLLVDRLGRLRQWFGHWLQGTSATTAAAR